MRTSIETATVTRKPTPAQAAVLGFLYAFHAEEDRIPTRAEIAEHFGWRSQNAADTHVQALLQRGLVEKRGCNLRFARTKRHFEVLRALNAMGQGEVSAVDQERELRIEAENLLMQAEMRAWERTGDPGAHGAADRHRIQWEKLISERTRAVQDRLADERGLPRE